MKPRYDMFSWLLSRPKPTETQPAPPEPAQNVPLQTGEGTALSEDVPSPLNESTAPHGEVVAEALPDSHDIGSTPPSVQSDLVTDPGPQEDSPTAESSASGDRNEESPLIDGDSAPDSPTDEPLLSTNDDLAAEEAQTDDRVRVTAEPEDNEREPRGQERKFLAPDPPTSPKKNSLSAAAVADFEQAPDWSNVATSHQPSGVSVPPPTAGGFVTIPMMPAGPAANVNTVEDRPVSVARSKARSLGGPLLARQIQLMRALAGKTEWVKPKVGMIAVELAPPKMRLARVTRVLARGRRVIAEIDETSRPYGYTLRYDGSYRLEGAPDPSAPRLVLGSKS